MLDLIMLTLLCSSAVTALHHPKVHEDVDEIIRNENIRTARDSDSTYRKIHHQPPVFKYESAKQQDHLKFRYAQQQKVTMVNGMAKSYKFQNQPRFTQQSESEDWQPFDPKVPKKLVDNVQGAYSKVVNKFYKPLLTKATPQNDNLNSVNADLLAEGSENVEKNEEPERRNSEGEYNKIVYVHPNQIQGHSILNTGEAEDSNVHIQRPETQLTALNDLIGKNPNIQLEGLKRLLEEAPLSQAVVEAPAQNQVGSIENTQFPQKIQISEDGKLSFPTSKLFDKNSLEDIQKQLDEASKLQTEQVLAKAQQEAQAQVAAQHKAIALAQAEAQKAALESIQKTLYMSPQALPLVQDNPEEYQTNVNTITPIQPQAIPPPTNVLPSVLNIQIPSQNTIQGSNKVHHQVSVNVLQNDVPLKQLIPQPLTAPRVVNIPGRVSTSLYKNVQPQSFGSKELLYYAPNHHHQIAAQLQAQKTLMAQVEAQNQAILQNHKTAPSAIRQILKSEEVGKQEVKQASSVHSVAHTEPEATTYQQIGLDPHENENGAEEQKDYDDFDDLQYAAKYAFGYRIKDAKEGNDFGHEERRDGKSLEGSYHVLLPDGRLQKVEYYADNSGYHAKVTYEHSPQK